MEIVVTSDAHGRGFLLNEIERWHPEAELFVNLGDLEENPQSFPDWLFVRGNNDFYSGREMPDERVLKLGDHKVLMLHSQYFPYFNREEQLSRYALDKGCDIVLYGHTHVPKIQRVNGVLLLNPGSLWQNRDGSDPSYAILNLDGPQTEAKIIHESDWPALPAKSKKEKKRWFW